MKEGDIMNKTKFKVVHEVEKRLRDTKSMLQDDINQAYKEKDVDTANLLEKYLTSVNGIIQACENRKRF